MRRVLPSHPRYTQAVKQYLKHSIAAIQQPATTSHTHCSTTAFALPFTGLCSSTTSSMHTQCTSGVSTAMEVQQHPRCILARPKPAKLQACRAACWSTAQAAPAAQHSNQLPLHGSIRTTSSSISSRAAAGCSLRCHSTKTPNPGSLHPQISWLSEVQAWPSQLPHTSGSSNGSGNGNGSQSSPATVQQQEFAAVQPSDLESLKFDAILVLAGGLTPDGGLPDWAVRRLDVARDLHMYKNRQPPIVCSGGGTPHKPAILGSSGHVIHESTSMATHLMEAGVKPGDIYKETSSYDTVGNTYFSLTTHVLPAGWTRLAVVTSHFHMPRSRALFADIYRLAGSSLFADPYRYSLTFLSASDEGVFDDYVYNARLGKEAGSLQHWQGVAGGLRSLADLHDWLHADHLCYAVPRQHEFGKRTIKDQKLLESY